MKVEIVQEEMIIIPLKEPTHGSNKVGLDNFDAAGQAQLLNFMRAVCNFCVTDKCPVRNNPRKQMLQALAGNCYNLSIPSPSCQGSREAIPHYTLTWSAGVPGTYSNSCLIFSSGDLNLDGTYDNFRVNRPLSDQEYQRSEATHLFNQVVTR